MTMRLLFFTGLWAALGLAYLSNGHQRLLAAPLPWRTAGPAALGLGTLAFAAGWQAMGLAVASFACMAWGMLWAGLWPLLGVAMDALKGALPLQRGAAREEAGR